MFDAVDKIYEKISSYNLLNFLLSGTLYAVFVKEISTLKLISDEVIYSLFVFYFLGAIISRFGSFIVEPTLKRLGFVKFVNYEDYIIASEKDGKIEVLSEINNMYRTIISLIVLIALTEGYKKIVEVCNIMHTITISIFITLIFILFLFSYKKQTKFIVGRVEQAIRNREEN